MKKFLCIVLSVIFVFSCFSVSVFAVETCNPGEHVFETEDDVYVPADCVNAGYVIHKCKVCGYTERVTTEPALGHITSIWKTVKEATCTEEGLEESECSRCHRTIPQVISVTSHKDENLDGKCDVCGTSLDTKQDSWHWEMQDESPFKTLLLFFKAIIAFFKGIFE